MYPEHKKLFLFKYILTYCGFQRGRDNSKNEWNIKQLQNDIALIKIEL